MAGPSNSERRSIHNLCAETLGFWKNHENVFK